MNATQTQIIEALATGPLDKKALVAKLGKDESTVRKNAKKLVDAGDLVLGEDKLYSLPTQPEPAPVELDETSIEIVAEATVTSGDKPAKKKYQRHAKPTTRTVRKNQITGFDVQVLRADEYEVDEPHGKWVTICLEHDVVGWSDKVLDAHFMSTYPEFCEHCAPLLVGKVGRRRKTSK